MVNLARRADKLSHLELGFNGRAKQGRTMAEPVSERGSIRGKSSNVERRDPPGRPATREQESYRTITPY